MHGVCPTLPLRCATAFHWPKDLSVSHSVLQKLIASVGIPLFIDGHGTRTTSGRGPVALTSSRGPGGLTWSSSAGRARAPSHRHLNAQPLRRRFIRQVGMPGKQQTFGMEREDPIRPLFLKRNLHVGWRRPLSSILLSPHSAKVAESERCFHSIHAASRCRHRRGQGARWCPCGYLLSLFEPS